MKSDVCNILFGGVGGQGILKASELCGWAAMYGGYHVKKSEVHGMAQRGGSVESHLRFGKKVFSPLIPKGQADILVCFHREEHARLKPFLKKGGIDLVSYIDKAAEAVKDPRYLNTYLVGVLSAYLPIKEEGWAKAIEKVFPAKFTEENTKVFREGKGAAANDLE